MVGQRLGIHGLTLLTLIVVIVGQASARLVPHRPATGHRPALDTGRSLDSLGGGNILRDVTQQLRQLDSLGGGNILRNVNYQDLPFDYRPAAAKKNFDEIDRAGFGNFVKKNFDEIDRAGFGNFVKKNFDEIDNEGFGNLVKRPRLF